MSSKTKYDAKTKKLKPLVKFNNGRGAVLCHRCHKIIRQGFVSVKGSKVKAEDLFCPECALDIVSKLLK